MKTTVDYFFNNFPPLSPIKTGFKSSGKKLRDIKAVVFDIYGTLLISGSGDVGTSMKAGSAEAFSAALEKCGINSISSHAALIIKELFFSIISETHIEMKKEGFPYPEIDIIEIWSSIIKSADIIKMVPEIVNLQPEIAAAAYEAVSNPVYPMPYAKDILLKLKSSGCKLGIISNAQFYTPLIIEKLFDSSMPGLGFSDDLCFFSYIERKAKPAPELFNMLTSQLKSYGISPAESVYIGNDMLKDILPAAESGYRTALFAGDKRSLRLRKDIAACSNIEPDVILNELKDLFDFIQEG